MINIILTEDHPIVRNGIKLLLESQQNFCVIGEASNGKETLRLFRNNVIPDVLITDISMDDMDGLQLTEEIRSNYPQVKIMILSMIGQREFISNCFAKGANAYLLKKSSYEEMLFAINHVAKGGRYLCDELSMDLIENMNNIGLDLAGKTRLIDEIELSDRELEVLGLISEGLTNIEIANKLFLSKRTVEGHRQNLINKTKVKNSAALIKYAVKNGLI
ncbi:two component transcriptional regulator, LuxR family [Pseudopedobacter saltans DSM 12145]|uniref:Two component transcriptional regulator, LuxR family n=1 Tax=Pseudopedobacter saltans (strain ATCC 51119 / DSM 12145 / JCM 21818 / CCUG 39354 / LMG 10337 / NBRC 100064 / NCIMB 13643) TaxID=762903 RepID=F0S4K7_PSESL|nr:response regulator transcription factor [Pseudopedobacter saltans]ADY51998.1 two component transcriptional regulator, LuxR family [Pseudopedobacter saltans DSM 12145]